MSALGTLRSTVLTRLGESTSSPVFWTTAEVDEALNKAINVFMSDTRFIHNKITVTRTGDYFTIPDECNGVDAIIYAGKTLKIVKPNQIDYSTGTASWATDAGTDAEYALFNMALSPYTPSLNSLISPSASAMTFRILPVLTTYTSADVYYVPYFSLVSDSTVPVPTLAEEALVFYAMAELLLKVGVEEDYNRSQMFMQKYAEIAQRFVFDNFTRRTVMNNGSGTI